MSARQWSIAWPSTASGTTTSRSVATWPSVREWEPTMTYAIVSILFATLETYVWLFRPNSHASPNPITIGLPLVVAAGIFKRSANERAAVLTFAAIGAVSLNRALIAQQSLVHVVVFGGAGYLAWWAYRRAEVSRAAFKRLAVVMGVTLGGFALVWLWQMMRFAGG